MVHLQRGAKELQTGRLWQALASYQQALTLAQVSGEAIEVAEINLSLGNIAVLLNELEQAEAALQTTQAIAQRLKVKEVYYDAEIALGYLAFKQGNYQDSKQRFLTVISALDIAQQQIFTAVRVRAINGLVINLRVENSLAEALRQVELAVNLSRSNQLTSLLADSLYNKASVLYYMGRYELAKVAVEQALAMDKALEKLPATASDLALLAKIEQKLKNPVLADWYQSNAAIIRRFLNR